MNLYGDDNDGGGLYSCNSDAYPPQQQQTEEQPAQPEVSASDAVTKSVELITNPAALLSQAVDPSTSKLPMGLAVLGACIFAMVWANSLSGGGERE